MFQTIKKVSVILLTIYSFGYLGTIGAQRQYVHPLNHNKIINGTPAALNQFPFQVSIQNRPNGDYFEHLCGGTIISPNCILTAAHCTLDQKINDTVIVAGSLNLNDTCKLPIHSISIHPQYSDAPSFLNDISVIKLSTPLVFDNTKQPIKLPTAANVDTPAGSIATTMGWGVTTVDGDLSSSLLYVQVPIVSDAVCANDYLGLNTIDTSMVCAGVGYKDSCQGDSGGPLIVNGVQVGIVSNGEGCADPKYPGVYTEVSYFLSYLQSEGCLNDINTSSIWWG